MTYYFQLERIQVLYGQGSVWYGYDVMMLVYGMMLVWYGMVCHYGMVRYDVSGMAMMS